MNFCEVEVCPKDANLVGERKHQAALFLNERVSEEIPKINVLELLKI